MLPLFIHDCDSCIFLGSYKHRDLYYCSSVGGETIINRYGNESGMYRSGLCFIYSSSPYPVECAERAIALGLLSPYASTGCSGDGTIQEEINKRRCQNS